MKTKIIRNSASCNQCNTEIESTHVHDFVGCPCWAESNGGTGIAVDGGKEYIRRCYGRDPSYQGYTDTSITEETE